MQGDINIETSPEDLVYSEDPEVVAGEERRGCGWCPPDEFEKVGAGADTLVARTLDWKEDTKQRDLYAKAGEAHANVYVVMTCITKVMRGRKELKTAVLTKYLQAMVLRNPTSVDLLARRIIKRTRLQDPTELYPEFRAHFGIALEPGEVPDAGSSKSDDAGG